MKSIIVTGEPECFLCGVKYDLEVHHCIHGSGRRKLADEDGLTVYLCRSCHRILHDRGINDRDLQVAAQYVWEREYGSREEFIKRYGRSYITE